jgi:hypothetical protein
VAVLVAVGLKLLSNFVQHNAKAQLLLTIYYEVFTGHTAAQCNTLQTAKI